MTDLPAKLVCGITYNSQNEIDAILNDVEKLFGEIDIKSEIINFDEKIKRDIDQIKYLRAIQEEFGIDIWNIIPEITD